MRQNIRILMAVSETMTLQPNVSWLCPAKMTGISHKTATMATANFHPTAMDSGK